MEIVNTFWALVPPLIAIVLALISKETYSSLFIGILVGALLVAGFSPIGTLDTMINDGFVPAVADNAGIFIFLVILGIMVALVNSTGGAAAFGKWAAKHIKSRAGSMIATFILGILIFIDDYFNCLTVGSVMRPVTDSHRVSRAKLSYIIDATAAPICMIAPISSWAAAVSGVAADLNVNGIQLFISAIPFNFYSLMTLIFVIAISIMGFDYGPMAKAEIEAWKGELGALGDEEAVENTRANLWDMLLPIILLIITCVIGMMYVGGFWDPEAEGFHNLALAFGDTDAYVALPWGGLIALVAGMIYLLARRVIKFKESMSCFVKGFNAMVPAILILTFAVTLKNMTGLLGADVFVAGLMEGAAAGLFKMLPAIIFLVAVFLAFSTGTSWGTFGILIPIVLPIFANDPVLLTIGISACLAGAVCGDHCSPISDTTIMASAGANVNHITHVSTQLPYALTVAGISFVTFIVAGFVQSAVISLIVGTVLTLGTLFVLRNTVGKKSRVAYAEAAATFAASTGAGEIPVSPTRGEIAVEMAEKKDAMAVESATMGDGSIESKDSVE
ncbi:MAG: Na+/H+ antiporter NhaC family protein [bacterium]|nr:Na+/H+ antiporter NhaC family protein [bacterium]